MSIFLLKTTESDADVNPAIPPAANPAFLTEVNYLSVRGAFAPILQGEFKLWELGAVMPIGLYQAAGVTVLGEDDGTVTGGTLDQDGRMVPSGTGERNVNSFFVFSYAVNPWNRLSLGVNILGAYQSNFGKSLKGIGADLGLSYRALRHPVLGDHVVGIATQNLLAPSMSESVKPEIGNGGQYARNLKLSWNSTKVPPFPIPTSA